MARIKESVYRGKKRYTVFIGKKEIGHFSKKSNALKLKNFTKDKRFKHLFTKRRKK